MLKIIILFLSLQWCLGSDGNRFRKFMHSLIGAQSVGEMKAGINDHKEFLFKLVKKGRLEEVYKSSNLPIKMFEDVCEEDTFFLCQTLKNPMEKTALGEVIDQEYFNTLIESVPDIVWEQALIERDLSIQDMDFSESNVLKLLQDPEKGLDLKDIPKAFASFLELLLDQYIQKLPLEDKRQMILGQISLDSNATDSKKLSRFLHTSGPMIQKFFQLFGDNVNSLELKEVLDELKNDIEPFDDKIAREIFERSTSKKIEDLFSKFGPRLAAASVGQVYIATLKESNEKVIVKIRRPGIYLKAQREIKTIKSLVKDPGILNIVNNLEESLFSELNFNLEAEGIQEGQVYNNFKKKLASVKQFQESTEEVLMMSVAPGKSLNKMTSYKEKFFAYKRLKVLYRKWLKEALYKSGFLHADLHSGNIFYQMPSRFAPEIMTLIDFGSVATLNKLERASIIRLSLGIGLNSTKTVFEGFRQLGIIPNDKEVEFRALIKNILAQDNDVNWKINEIFNSAILIGLKLPKNLLQFNRGKLFLESQIDKLAKELKRKIKKDPPSQRIYAEVLKKGLVHDLKWAAINRKRDNVLMERSNFKALYDNAILPFMRFQWKRFRRQCPEL